jgi:hypothetical protein
MKNEGDQEQESLITIEDEKFSSKKAPKRESPNSVEMYILIIDITDNYEDQN